MIADALTAQRIGADWLDAQLAPAGEPGRAAEAAALPFGPGDEDAARAACAAVLETARGLDAGGVARVRAALAGVRDVRTLAARARLGEVLEDVDFFALGAFADALAAARDAWHAAGGGSGGPPAPPAAVAAALAPGWKGGAFYLADAFDAELSAARARFAAADAACGAALHALAAAAATALGFEPGADDFIALRDVLPDVPCGVRVVREAPAYRVLALERDDAAHACERERDAALEVVAACEDAVRRRLSEAIARAAAGIDAAVQSVARLDMVLARVAFVQRWGGTLPRFAHGRLAFTRATFAPLAAALTAQGLPYVPVSLEVRGAAVLVGPNMGGKTAALATCGFLAACIARGVPPPADDVTLPLAAAAVWIGSEREPDAGPLLSAFAAEIVRARDVLAIAPRPALVLVDEFARTTAPRDGRALLTALVEALAARGDVVLAATHLDGVAPTAAHFAAGALRAGDAPPRATTTHDAVAALARAMEYRIVPADAGAQPPSEALALADVLGLDASVVERARALAAEEPDAWSR